MVSFRHYHHLITEKELFVTSLLFLVLQLDKKFYEDEESISYTWVREYLWDVRINSATFKHSCCIIWGAGGGGGGMM